MIKIDKKEVLRYLGYDNQIMDKELNEMIDSTISKVEKVQYKYVYNVFDISKGEKIKVLNTTLELEGVSIENILKYSDEIIIFAATLGQEVDKKINNLKHQNLTEMMIWDSCASEMIEKILDELECEIKEKYKKFLAPRFSPGYGDLSLTNQRSIIKILDASKKIGLMVNESSILMPKKSVTGIIGLQNQNMKVHYRACDDCLIRLNCDLKTCKKGASNEI